LVGTNVKIEKFVLDYFKQVNYGSDIKKNEHIYDILMACSYTSDNNILDKEMLTLYFKDKQLSLIKEKQKKLGYEGNFNRFVRYALFDFFMVKHNMTLSNKFFDKLIDYDKFNLLLEKCKNELINGEYTSYDIDLLRNNKKYEEFFNEDELNDVKEEIDFNLDYLEHDMLTFLACEFIQENKYSELIGLATDGEDLENIVPDVNTFYYLFLYYAFMLDHEDLDIDEIFDETDEHIDSLLEKYTFEKIIKHNKNKGVVDINEIFDEECLLYLKSNELIDFDEYLKLDEEPDIGEASNDESDDLK